MKKLDLVEYMRALAILFVVVFHVSGEFLPFGYIGVDIFMTISGFVIARSVISRFDPAKSFDLFSFMRRRIRRLGPPMIFAAVFTLPILALSQSPLGAFHNSAQTLVASFLGLSNGLIQYLNGGYFGSDAQLNGYLHTWSLSVEVQFYFLFSVIALLTLIPRARKPLGNLALVNIAVGLISLLLLLGSNMMDLAFAELGIYGYYSPLVRIWQFSIGVAIAMAPAPKKLSASFTGVGVIFVFLAASLDMDPVLNMGVFSNIMVASFGTGIVLYFGQELKLPSRGSLSLLGLLGTLSYPWYLIHWPMIVAATSLHDSNISRLTGALISLLIAYFYISVFENKTYPPRTFSSTRKSVGIFAVSVPTIFSIVLAPMALTSFGDERLRDYRNQVSERHLPSKLSWLCATGPLNSKNFYECLVQGEKEESPIYLVGDSQAGQISEAVLAASRETGRSMIVSTTTSCPFFSEESGSQRCNLFHSKTVEFLSGQKAGDVIIAFSSSNAMSEASLGSFESSLATLTDRGHQVTLVGPIPLAGYKREFNPRQCNLASVQNSTCFFSFPKSQISGLAQNQEEVFRGIADGGAIQFVSLVDSLCRQDFCQTMIENTILYRDPSHLSVEANKLLESSFLKALGSE